MADDKRSILIARARALFKAKKSWRAIGKALGVDHTQIYRWVKQADKAASSPVEAAVAKTRRRRTLGGPEQERGAGLPRIPDARERKYAAGLLDGKTRTAAAKDALPSGTSKSAADNWAFKTAQDPGFKEFFLEVMAAKGVTPEALAETHAGLLKATKVVAGQVVDDNAAQNSALKLAYDVLGLTGQQQDPGTGNVVIQINADTAKMYAGLCGGELPDGFEIRPEAIDVSPAEDAAVPS